MPTITSNYGGQVLEDFLSRSTMGAETIAKGCMAVHSNIMEKKSLPRITMADIIQDHAVTPTSAGTVTVDERTLTPVPFNAFKTFNPRNFEVFHEFANPTTGEVLYRELPPAAQVAFLQQIAMLVGEFMEDGVWRATTATGGGVLQDKWNGIETRAAADADVNDVASPVALTSSNIADKIAATRDALVSAGSRGRAAWNSELCKIFMSHASADLYRDYLEGLSNKGPTVTDAYELRYRGKMVVPCQGMSDNTILITKGSEDPMTSNLHLGIDWQYDSTNPVVQFGKYRPESELMFFKVLMQADTNYTWAEEIGFYQFTA